MTCPFGTMDWYCCLAAGHDGPHESHELPPDTSTNPPPVASLDVEAPKTHAVQCREEGRPQDWWLLKAMTPEGKVSNGQSVDVEACVRLLKQAQLTWAYYGDAVAAEHFGALASALPGMGKKADWYDWLAEEDHVDWVRRLGNGNFAVETPPFGMKPDIERATLGECIAAARAAQPEETSADG